MLLIFSKYHVVQVWARYAILFVGALAVLNNIYELLNPLIFSGLNDTGRPAGFYVDPNRSGCALVLSMIFSTEILPQKYRPYLISFIGLGILLTFSRGAILGWILVTLIFIKKRVISKHQIVYWLIAVGVLVVGLGFLSSEFVNINQLPYGIRERLEWFENPTGSEHSADSRMDILIAGWQLFLQSPLWGNGIASTIEWSFGISTHNMYLFYMTDHGFLGILILPLLVYAVTRNSRGESQYIALAFATFIILWGIFSHTVIEDRFILLSFALMATLSVTSQQEEKYRLGHNV
ncbi:O-antigen ligase family protein [Gloeocapsopsis dulcis]|nr:O-antigen ligase family protein [Gloeocapsopsis dulcis]WNN90833.1 O-antigen ligase family protein [Gloeocapsopsis dulcis]